MTCVRLASCKNGNLISSKTEQLCAICPRRNDPRNGVGGMLSAHRVTGSESGAGSRRLYPDTAAYSVEWSIVRMSMSLSDLFAFLDSQNLERSSGFNGTSSLERLGRRDLDADRVLPLHELAPS